MYGKLGVPFFTLLIILFRMAEFYFIPQLSPLTPPILGYLGIMFQIMCKIELWTSLYLVYPVLQIIGSWLPFTVFATTIWCLNVLFYPIMWIIWWTMYLFSVWKYLGVTGRTFREMLADPHRDTITESPTYKHYLMRNGLLVDMKLAEHETKGDIRSHVLNFHNDWVAFIQYYQACVQNCKKSLCDHLPACDELEDVLYWVYSISLCGIGVIYFMVRMLKYRMGYLTISRGKIWSKNRSKWRRSYHRQISFEH